jgi:hypothetical protein
MDFIDSIISWDHWEAIGKTEILFRLLIDFFSDHWQNFEPDITGSGNEILTYAYNSQADAAKELENVHQQATDISEFERKQQ